MSRSSLYDQDGDEEPWFARSVEADDEPLRTGDGEHDLADWKAAERNHTRLLAESDHLLGRLSTVMELEGGVERLALIEASDLLWIEGVRIRSERLSLAAANGGGDDPELRSEYALGLWAYERLARSWSLENEEDLLRFLGRRRSDGVSDLGELGVALSGESEALRGGWLEIVGSGAVLHPITRAAMAVDLWRRLGAGGRERDVEATIIGARLAAADRLAFVPLMLGGKRRLGGSGGADDILYQFLEALNGASLRALLELGRLREWRERAATAPLKKNPRALIGLLNHCSTISTSEAETYLGSTRATALAALNTLVEFRLCREITGQQSYFYWTAELSLSAPRGR